MSALSASEKVDVRRHCGYPAVGATATGMPAWRFFQAHGLLEYRMTNLSEPETTVVRKFLATLNDLEIAIPRTSDNMDTDRAAAWTRNPDELAERVRVFEDWRRRLCGFFGLPPGSACCTSSPAMVV